MSFKEQQAITLKSGLFSFQKNCQCHGVLMPWEVKSYSEDFLVAKNVGGIFDLSDYVTLQISGKEAENYLQRMTTVQFKTLGCVVFAVLF